ncbi:hypothetical protein BTS2_0243 [Bacillus sp. TS-2]|nr:hypothetical protein BTS2_0243 [Bacillus sp. TS-2]
MLTKPNKLKRGDKIATISTSWGGAGDSDLIWRYHQGVERLESIFGLEIVPMPNSLKGSEYLYQHPKARAEDLLLAFSDPSIKGVFANIGGEDSVRLLPYIDYKIIENHPKIFMGYSDVTISHLICHKAGLSSFYGPAILTDFAENVAMDSYTIEMVNRTLFSNEVIGEIAPAKEWTSEFLAWEEKNKLKKRRMYQNSGYHILQGSGKARGRLIGGCIEVLEFAKGTELWPKEEYWQDSILFLETAEVKSEPDMIRYWLRNYATQGILQKLNGMIFAKPYDDKYAEEYKSEIIKVMKEYGLTDLPILFNVNFGHTEPKCILPYGILAELDCEHATFSILESAVQ